MTKHLLYDIDGNDLLTPVEKGVETNAHARMTRDCKKGLAKFLEKLAAVHVSDGDGH